MPHYTRWCAPSAKKVRAVSRGSSTLHTSQNVCEARLRGGLGLVLAFIVVAVLSIIEAGWLRRVVLPAQQHMPVACVTRLPH